MNWPFVRRSRLLHAQQANIELRRDLESKANIFAGADPAVQQMHVRIRGLEGERDTAQRERDEAQQQSDLWEADYRREYQRFNHLWYAMGFPVNHHFGGDPDEARDGVDYAILAAPLTKSAISPIWCGERKPAKVMAPRTGRMDLHDILDAHFPLYADLHDFVMHAEIPEPSRPTSGRPPKSKPTKKAKK